MAVPPSSRLAPGAHRLAVAARLGHVPTAIVASRYLPRWTSGGEVVPDPDARAALSASLAELSAGVDRALAVVFREYVGATVLAVSPLVASACRIEGLDLDAVAGSIRHDGAWRSWLGGPPPTPGARWRRAGPAALACLQERAVLRQFGCCGAVVRELGDPGGALGFRVGPRCLEIAVRTDRMELSTDDGRAVLTLRGPLPETVRLAARGRLLDDVVDLPLASGRGLRIADAVARRSGGTSLVFDVEPLPWRMPWAREWIRDDEGG